MDGQPDDHARDRGATGVVRVEDLGEESAEGDERGVDGPVVGDPLGGQGVLDHLCVQDLSEGEAPGLVEGSDLLGDLASGRLRHGRPPDRDRTRISSYRALSQRRPPLVYPRTAVQVR